MAFFTRPELDNRQFKQVSGSTLTLSGDTQIAPSGSLTIDGDLVLDGKQIVATGGTAGQVLTLDTDGKIKLLPSSGSGGTGFYNGASPSNITVGGIPAGTVLTGKTYDDLFEELLITYLAPAFGSFSVTGQATMVEVGTTLTGSKTFTWSTTNPSNVQTNSIAIRDQFTNTLIGSGLANDGSESLSITTRTFTNDTQTQPWRVEGVNTNLVPFNSGNFTVSSKYYRFFGPAASQPANSAQVRALPVTAFQTAASNTFILNTGTVQTTFYVALPPLRIISSVIDIDALNANITSSYVLVGTVSVLDDGGVGTPRTYNLYKMTVGVPYSTNHQHQITTA